MAAQQSKTDLLSRLANRLSTVHEKHKGEEINLGSANLPSGIINGLAQLQSIKVQEYKTGEQKGELHVLFRGVAASPENHRDVRVKGQGVMLTIPLCNTPGRKADALSGLDGTLENWFIVLLGELQKFKINTRNTTFASLGDTLDALEKQKPWFRFSTRGWTPAVTPQNPNPTEMVFVQFDGRCDPVSGVVTAPGAAIADSTGATPSTNGTAHDAGEPSGGSEVFTPEQIMEMSTAADDDGDMAAVENLTDLALANGYTQQQVADTPSWTALGKELVAKLAPPPAKPTAPSGDVSYTPPKGRKPVVCSVVKVYHKGQTADLQSKTDKKMKWSGVAWSEVAPA